MSINMILATGLNGELGQTSSPNGLPWKHNPDDMKMFRELTTGNVVVYGGNTFRQFQKMGMKYGLPNRTNVIVSRKHHLTDTDNNVYVQDIQETVDLIQDTWFTLLEDVFIIGGKSIYNQLHQHCDKVYLTRINQEFPDADVKIDLDFLRDFGLSEIRELNTYSQLEIHERIRNGSGR